jgi:hypothetical protein
MTNLLARRTGKAYFAVSRLLTVSANQYTRGSSSVNGCLKRLGETLKDKQSKLCGGHQTD